MSDMDNIRKVKPMPKQAEVQQGDRENKEAGSEKQMSQAVPEKRNFRAELEALGGMSISHTPDEEFPHGRPHEEDSERP